MNSNTGHGHVLPRPDGMRARCGGPSMCVQCAKDQARMNAPTSHARDIAAREHAALAHLTDAQALATWERMKAVRKAYVEAIIEKVPA